MHSLGDQASAAICCTLCSAALGLPLPWRLPTRLSHDFILHHDFMGAGRRVYQVVVLRILLGRSLPVSPTAALSLPLPLQLLSLRAFLSNRCLLLNNACHHWPPALWAAEGERDRLQGILCWASAVPYASRRCNSGVQKSAKSGAPVTGLRHCRPVRCAGIAGLGSTVWLCVSVTPAGPAGGVHQGLKDRAGHILVGQQQHATFLLLPLLLWLVIITWGLASVALHK